MIIRKYEYDGVVYETEQAVRQAIFETERKAFGSPKNEDDWMKLGVYYSEEEVFDSSLRDEKMKDLEATFEEYLNSKSNYFKSSLGMSVNGTLRSQLLIEGLALQAEDGDVQFRDYDNNTVFISLDEVNVLRKEISKHISNLYSQKWELKFLLEECSEDELDDIVIKFSPSNFMSHVKILKI